MAKGTLKQKQQRQDKEKQAYAFYIAQGWTPEQAIGIVGNLIRESNLNTTVVGTADDKGSQGLAQWHSGRLKTLKDRYGNKWTDFRNQLEFVDWELKNTEKAAGDKLKASKGIWEAGKIVSDSYERPKVKFSGDETRQRHVSDLAMKFKGVKLTPEDMPYFDASYANSVAPYMNQTQETVTPAIKYFDIPKETATFASAPDSAEEDKKEELDKDVAEVEQKTKEYNFLEELQKEDYSHLQPEQVAQQQTVPQVNFNKQFEQVSQFIDEPLFAQQGLTWQEKLANRPKKLTVAEIIAEGDARKVQQRTQSDNTKVSNYNGTRLFNPNVMNKTDKEIAQEREARIQASVEAQKTPYTKENWRQQLASETSATGDKLRVSLEPNFFDDYINPAAMIGNMASNLGQAPLQAQQSDSVMPYVTSVGVPLVTGALAGVGAKTTGQFANNIVNPLAGTEDLVSGIGNKTKKFVRNNILTDKVFNRLETLDNATSDKFYKFINPKHHIEAQNALNEANTWMDDWYNSPATKQKIKDITFGSVNEDLLNRGIKDKTYIASFEKPINKIADFITGTPRVHRGNYGVSGYGLDVYADTSKRQNLVDKYIDTKGITSTAIHEGNHGITDGNKLIQDYDRILLSPFDQNNLQSRLADGSYARHEDYLLDPTEINARISEIRYENKIKPDQKLTTEQVNKIIDKGLKGESQVDSDFYKLINDRDRFTWMINKVPSIAPIAGASYLATQGQEEPKKLQQGGEFSENELAFLSEIAIKDNNGYWDKNNQGKVLEIEGNKITMKGVKEDIIGISKQTGEKKIMKPNKNYTFSNTKSVIEVPLFKK